MSDDLTPVPGADALAAAGSSDLAADDLPHFAITDPLPGGGTTLLEASAGTGKTWTIAALVTRYVAEGHATLPEMLVVTFGRAASQELRTRVREQLVEAAGWFAHAAATAAGEEPVGGANAPSGPLAQLLLDGDPQTLALRGHRVREALASFDSATIATTHQFCQQVLRSLGVAGNTDPGTQLVEDLDDLLVEVVDDLYLRQFAGSEHEPPFTRGEALTIAREAVNDAHAEIRPLLDEPRSPATRRARFAQVVRDTLDARKRRLRVMHYNDLLSQLADALESDDSPARQRMRSRWAVVLVDEFQDTDPVQWQVLDRAFTGHATMVLIGDPKQAIYAFRGGDVATYLRAAGSATTKRTLPRNYRSDQPVVDALGAMLGGAALGDDEIVVRPIEACREGSRLHGAGSHAAVRLRHVTKDDAPVGGIGGVRAHVADDLARDVAALLASGATFDDDSSGETVTRPLVARDIAVIAQTNRTLVEVQAALRRAGVHAVTTGGSNVLQSRAAHDWLALLDAMATPHRRALARAAALTSLLGRTAAELDAGGDEVDDEIAARLRALAAVYERQGVAAVLEALTITGLPTRVLSRVGGERELTDLRHVAELLHETSDRGRVGLTGLVEWLRAQMADDAPQSSGARTRRLDSDASAVQLVTVHGSKGLQYPVVYLPSLWDRYTGREPAVVQYHDGLPERTRCLEVGGPGSPTREVALEAHRIEDDGESLRLLYVALTRAQSQVVMWWAESSYNTPASPLHRMLFGRKAGEREVRTRGALANDEMTAGRLRQWAEVGAFAYERAELAPLAQVPPGDDLSDVAIRQLTRRIDHAWRRTSYTALSTPRDAEGFEVVAGVSSEPELELRDDEPESAVPGTAAPTLPGLATGGDDVPSPMAGLPVGATFGSLVHAVLEHADPQAADLRAELLEHIEEQRVRWPVDLDAGELADALVAVCDTPLGPLAGGATLRSIGQRDRLCEMGFELPLGGGDLAPRVRAGTGTAGVGEVVLGDLVPLLRQHLRAGDPVRAWADVLEAQPALADQPLRGYLTGSVDVVLRTGGRYLVVDYKTNWLGGFDEPLMASAYRREALDEAMGHSSYPLQALLYAVVAHRYLRWRLPGYNPDTHLGGVLYLYVRGMCGPQTPVVDDHPCGVFSWRPPAALVQAVSALLDGSTTPEVTR